MAAQLPPPANASSSSDECLPQNPVTPANPFPRLSWMINTAASHHHVHKESLLENKKSGPPVKVKMSGGMTAKASTFGEAAFHGGMMLRNVYYVPESCEPTLSVPTLVAQYKDLEVMFDGTRCLITNRRTQEVLATGVRDHRGLYIVGEAAVRDGTTSMDDNVKTSTIVGDVALREGMKLKNVHYS